MFNITWPPSSNGTWDAVISPTVGNGTYLITDGTNLFQSGADIYKIDPDTLTETLIRSTGQHWAGDSGGRLIIFKNNLYACPNDTIEFQIWKYDGTGSNWTKVFDDNTYGYSRDLIVVDVNGTETMICTGQDSPGYTQAGAYTTDGVSFTNPLTFPEPQQNDSATDGQRSTKITPLQTLGHSSRNTSFVLKLLELVGSNWNVRESPRSTIYLGANLYWNTAEQYTVSINPSPNWISPSEADIEPNASYGISNHQQFGIKLTNGNVRFWDNAAKQWYTTPVDTINGGLSISSAICVTSAGKAFAIAISGGSRVLLQRSPNYEGSATGGNGASSIGNLWVYKTTNRGLNWSNKGVHT